MHKRSEGRADTGGGRQRKPRPQSGRYGPARVKAVNQIVGQLSQYGSWQ
jgi:hypothetical protein